MRGAWWKIARLELKLAFRDRESLIWSLIAPIAMAWLFGSMFGAEGQPEPTRVVVEAGVNPSDLKEIAEFYLKDRGFEIADTGTRIILPDSMMDRLQDGRPVNVRVIQDGDASLRARSVSAAVREMSYHFAFHLTETPGERIRPLYLTDAKPYLDLKTETRGTAPKIVTGKERTLPSMLIMFIMFQVMTFFMSLWVDDLQTGKIKRIVMSPVTTRDLFLGEITARLVWASLQVIVILGLGSLVMGIRLHVPWFNFALVLFAFMLAAASIGMMAASFFKTSEKAGAVGVLVSLVMAALGGCWWPLEVVPDAMRAVALVLPTGQAMSAIGEMLALGPSAPFPARAIVVLLAMALVAMPIAVRRMRVQLVQ